jgi:hypothetical protein
LRSTCSTASTFLRLREEKRPRSAFDFAMVTFNEGAVCPKSVPKEIVGGSVHLRGGTPCLSGRVPLIQDSEPPVGSCCPRAHDGGIGSGIGAGIEAGSRWNYTIQIGLRPLLDDVFPLCPRRVGK